MKHILFLILPVFLMNFSYSQKIETSIKSEITGIMIKQQEDWSNGNIEAYMEGYWKSDSLRFVTKKGITYGWQNMLDSYKKSYPDKNTMGILKFDIISMEALSGEKVLVVGKWTLTREKDQLMGYYTLIWKKIKGNWVIILDHTS